MKRLSPLAAAVAIVAAMVVPAVASAAPSKLTNWSPARTDTSASGKWQSVAVNPKNGNQLVVMSEYSVYAQTRYTAGIWDENSTQVGSLTTILAPPDTDSTYATPVGAYNPKTGGWLVVSWNATEDDYQAQLLNANGTLSGSPQIISADPDTCCGHNPDIVWDSAKQQFFVAWADYGNFGGGPGQPQGRFVNPTTAAPIGSAPIDLVTNQADFVWDDYHSMQIAYSTKQDGFGVMFRGKLQTGGYWRPYFLRLDSDGQPIGTAVTIPSGANGEITNGSIAYSKASDRYAVAWSDYTATPLAPVLVQLFDATNGNAIGSPVSQPVPADATSNRLRIHISADEYGSGYAITSTSDNDTTGTKAAYALWLDADAQPVGTPGWISDGVFDAVRPQIAFDGHSGCFRTTYLASFDITEQDYNVYSSRFGTSSLAEDDCSKPPSGKKKPSLKKAGTAGATSLRVKVGCGGASACRIKLSGKLKVGSGKLEGKTFKVKAGKKKTVTLGYTGDLISQLRGRSGAKIKVSAKQVGGKSRTITVRVPDSVTG